MPIERIIGQAGPDEEVYLTSLRPRRLDECIGQEIVREQLRIALDAARQRREPLDHVLLDGPPGLGKTTLAHIIAEEMGAGLHLTSGPAITRQGDLMMMLTQLEAGDVIFVDEIHRLHKVVEEFLYPALEDFRVDYTTESGIGGRTVNFALKRFTLIGATTRAGMLSSALHSRFGLFFHLQYYSTEELTRIVARNAELLKVAAERPALELLASRSRGTPRIANRLLRRVRDYAEVRADGRITAAVADAALTMLDVDHLGLDLMDRKLLGAMLEKFGGGPVGLDNLAAAIGESSDTIEDVLEPYLIQQGYLQRTPRGRMATASIWQHFGLQPPGGASGALWKED